MGTATNAKEKESDRAVSATFSLPMWMHAKIQKRARALKMTRSGYVQKLIEEDQ